MTRSPCFTLLMLACLPLLAACGANDPPPPTDPATAPTTIIGKAVKQATDQARKELVTENFKLSVDGLPQAEITPTGDLLIEGKAVPVDAAQKALLLDYRKGITDIAEAGIGVGLQGADLAGKAVTDALTSVFTGKTDEMEKRIEAEAAGIKQSAMKLCERMPALLAAQDRLAASLPAFKPYATLDQGDIDDCKDGNSTVDIGGDRPVDAAIDKNTAQNAAQEAEAAEADAPASTR